MEAFVKQAIEENIELIEEEQFEIFYDKLYRAWWGPDKIDEVTKTLHECNIFPEFSMEKLPSYYISVKDDFEGYLEQHPTLLNHLAQRKDSHPAVRIAYAYKATKDAKALYSGPDAPPYFYNKQTASDYKYAKDYVTELIIEDSITRVPGKAYSGSMRLTKVILGSKVKILGEEAFSGCYQLKEINFPDSLKQIGKYCFYGTALTNVLLPDNVIDVFEGAFKQCAQLTSIRFSSAQPEIAEYVCAGDRLLEKVIIPIGNADVIRSNAFNACLSISSIILPSNITTIQDAAFRSCSGLISINLNKVKIINPNAFDHCISLTDVEMPFVTNIGNRAFSYCTNLKEITIPESCISVGANVFDNCNRELVVAYNSLASTSWTKGWNKGIRTRTYDV